MNEHFRYWDSSDNSINPKKLNTDTHKEGISVNVNNKTNVFKFDPWTY